MRKSSLSLFYFILILTQIGCSKNSSSPGSSSISENEHKHGNCNHKHKDSSHNSKNNHENFGSEIISTCYEGSEAQVLKKGFLDRLELEKSLFEKSLIEGTEFKSESEKEAFIQSTEINGVTVDHSHLPEMFQRFYRIDDAALAMKLGFFPGYTLSEEALSKMDQDSEAVSDIYNGLIADKNQNTKVSPIEDTLSPSFTNERTISEKDKIRIKNITDRIMNAIKAKDEESPISRLKNYSNTWFKNLIKLNDQKKNIKHFMNSYHLRGKKVNSSETWTEIFNIDDDLIEKGVFLPHSEVLSGAFYLRLHNNQYDRGVFIELLNAIEKDDEESFVQMLFNLATCFTYDLKGPQETFVKNFVHLFVTKQFMSEGMRQTYFHFILRCGMIH